MAQAPEPRGREGRRPSGAHDAFAAAARHLSSRPRTVAEVRRRLKDLGFAEAAIRAAIGKMEKLGYLDDRALASRYAVWSVSERPMGRSRLAMELSRRGVSADVIDQALKASFTPRDESEALDRALGKAVRGAASVGAGKRARRLAAYLLRRGFGPAAVMAAVEAWSRRAAEDVDEPEENEA